MNDEANLELGGHIRSLREARSLSVRALARKAGLDDANLSRIERGQRMQSETIKRVALALEISVGELVQGRKLSISEYLRAHYPQLPEERLREAERYMGQLVGEYKVERLNPEDIEDEVNELFRD